MIKSHLDYKSTNKAPPGLHCFKKMSAALTLKSQWLMRSLFLAKINSNQQHDCVWGVRGAVMFTLSSHFHSFCLMVPPFWSLNLRVPVNLLYLDSRQGQEGSVNYTLVLYYQSNLYAKSKNGKNHFHWPKLRNMATPNYNKIWEMYSICVEEEEESGFVKCIATLSRDLGGTQGHLFVTHTVAPKILCLSK